MSDIIESFGFETEDQEALQPYANLADKYLSPFYREEMRREVRERAMYLALRRDLADERDPFLIMEEWEEIQSRNNLEDD